MDCPSIWSDIKAFSEQLRPIFAEYSTYDTKGDGNCSMHAVCVALNNYYGKFTYSKQDLNEMIATRITEDNFIELRLHYANNSMPNKTLRQDILKQGSVNDLKSIIASKRYYVELTDLAYLSRLLDIWILPINQQYGFKKRAELIRKQICVVDPFNENNQYFYDKIRRGKTVSVILVYLMSHRISHYRLIAQDLGSNNYKTVFAYTDLPQPLKSEIKSKFVDQAELKTETNDASDRVIDVELKRLVRAIKRKLLGVYDNQDSNSDDELTDSDEEDVLVCKQTGCYRNVKNRFKYCDEHIDGYILRRLRSRVNESIQNFNKVNTVIN